MAEPLDAKRAESLVSSGADVDHPDLAPFLEDAERRLCLVIEERGLGNSLDLSDSAMLRRFIFARKLQIDATADMLALARDNRQLVGDRIGFHNV